MTLDKILMMEKSEYVAIYARKIQIKKYPT